MDRNAEEPNKWLFVVKKHSLVDSQEKGIACAVKKTVNGQPRTFLLTCKDTQNEQENIFAHCVCSRDWFFAKRWFSNKHTPIDISSFREDEMFSFTSVERKYNKCLPMVSEDQNARKKLAEGLKDGCHSFVDEEESFRTVRWLYEEKQGLHYLNNADLPKHEHQALGSPVLWTGARNHTFVVGVVGRSDGKLCPKFFTDRALQITEVPMSLQLEELPLERKEGQITLKWSKPQDGEEPIIKYTVYQRNLTESGGEDTVLATIEDNSVCNYTVVGLERGKKYEFTVTATNRHGEGLKGQGLQVKVSKDVPMPVELQVSSSGAGSNRFTLKWVEPNNNGASILNYMVYQRTVNEDGERGAWEHVKTVAASTLASVEYLLTLERGKTFDLMVTAQNRRGESKKIEDNVKTVTVPEDIPEPVQMSDVPSYVTSHQTTLKWKKPNENGATITGYLVYQRTVTRHGKKSDWVMKHQTSALNHECRITLEKGEKYHFIVTAKNNCGESLKSEENAKRVEVAGDFLQEHSKFVHKELVRLLKQFVIPLAEVVSRRIQVLEDVQAGLGRSIWWLSGVLVLLTLWASGVFGFASVVLVLLAILAVWHFRQKGNEATLQHFPYYVMQLETQLNKLLPPFVLLFRQNVFETVQKLKANFAEIQVGLGPLFWWLSGGLALLSLWASGVFGFSSLFLVLLGIVAVWHFWQSENFENILSEFLDLFLMGILAVCCHWIAGLFLNVGLGSLLLLVLGTLAVWHFWRTDVLANVGYKFLVLFVLGSLVIWCLWSSGFIGFGFLSLFLLGIAVALPLWAAGNEESFQAFRGHARQFQTRLMRLLPPSVLTFWRNVSAGDQKLKEKFANFANVGSEFLIGSLAVCCLYATGFFVNVGILVLLFFGLLITQYLWRAGGFTHLGFLFWFLGVPTVWHMYRTEYFGFGAALVWLVLGGTAIWYLYPGLFDGKKVKKRRRVCLVIE